MIQFTNTSDRSATPPMTVWELVVANLDATNHIVAGKMILNLRQIISSSRSWFKKCQSFDGRGNANDDITHCSFNYYY